MGMSGALNNIKVLDITHVLAGPFCAYQLGLLGADVLKIESPTDPDCARGRGPDDAANAEGLGLNYLVQGGNKRALAMDLATPEGKAILLRLVRNADVLVENYATDALAGLGLGYDVLAQENPNLIHCSITGYGDTGPNAKMGAYDNVIQAVSGTIAQCDGVKPGVSFIDYSTGYCAAFAVSAALIQRMNTGKGCHISVSMLEVAMQIMSPEVAAAQHPIQADRGKEAGISAYDTSDGRLMLGAFRAQQYKALYQVLAGLGHEVAEIADIQNWPDIWAISDVAKNRLAAVFAEQTTDEWITVLRRAGLPVEPVQALRDAVQNPQLAARRYFVPSSHDPQVTLPQAAYHMSEGGPALVSDAPKHGEHSVAVLSELGLSDQEISDLVKNGIVLA